MKVNALPAPHTHSTTSVRTIMYTVWAALLPASLYGVWLFGWPALNLLLVATVSALLTEALMLQLARKPVGDFVFDGSGLLTAWLLAMSLPPWAPWWIAAVGSFFAIVVGKQVFGGIGQNIFNPAMLARVALLISFPLEMTQWVNPMPLGSETAPGFKEALAITFGGHPDIDAISGASILGHIKTELALGTSVSASLEGQYSLLVSLMGSTRGSLAETSALFLFIGGLFLVARKIISWHIPVAMMGSVLVAASLAHLISPDHYVGPLVHLTSGGLILGAFFIATDPVGSPATAKGKLIFGAGCGLLIYAIRTWGGYPEGLAFAVLIMNAMTPLIDHYIRPRIYGRERDGSPIDYKKKEARS